MADLRCRSLTDNQIDLRLGIPSPNRDLYAPDHSCLHHEQTKVIDKNRIFPKFEKISSDNLTAVPEKSFESGPEHAY